MASRGDKRPVARVLELHNRKQWLTDRLEHIGQKHAKEKLCHQDLIRYTIGRLAKVCPEGALSLDPELIGEWEQELDDITKDVEAMQSILGYESHALD